MLLPYRVKNPPKKFPYATLTLIAINLIVYACTTKSFMVIHKSVVEQYAYTMGATPLINVLTATFLHGDIFHLLGNMLFLWIVGPSVEDRLGIPKFLLVYFATGLIGNFSQGILDGLFLGGHQPIIGASGCIMGVAGAYWFAFPWSTVCVAYFFWIIRIYVGVWEVQAIWVIGAYILLDLYNGIVSGSMGAAGGVANFAHVGGGIAGILLCLAFRVKRDDEALSEARAIQADFKDLDNMPFHALRTMMEADPHNLKLLQAMYKPALKLGESKAMAEAIHAYGPTLVNEDPHLVLNYLMILQGDPSIFQSVHLLRLGGTLERSGDTEHAIEVYKLIADGRPTDPVAESAFYKLAVCLWNTRKDADSARRYLLKLRDGFPHSEMIPFARQLWNQMQPPKGSG